MTVSGPRRISSGRPGVYFRESERVMPSGRVKTVRTYEVSYVDSTGRRRWQTISGGLQDAVALRESLRTKIRAGERIAPSRKTVAEVAAEWLGSQANLRPRTRERYDVALRTQVLPRLGRLKVSDVTVDHVSTLVREMQEAVYFIDVNGRYERRIRRRKVRREGKVVHELAPFAAWSIRATLTPISGMMAFAIRRGWAAYNPVARLERGERPSTKSRRPRILAPEEIGALLGQAGRYRPLLATAVFTGMRQGELLGLVWREVDFDAGMIHVSTQLDRKTRQRVEPKTEGAKRSIALAPFLARLLREHKLESAHSADGDFVFSSIAGTGLAARNVATRGLERAAKRAGLVVEGKPRLRFHDLRHGYGSALIAQGLDLAHVSKQMGHASPAITASIYLHEFDEKRNAERTRNVLEAAFAGIVEHSDGTPPSVAVGCADGGKVVEGRFPAAAGNP